MFLKFCNAVVFVGGETAALHVLYADLLCNAFGRVRIVSGDEPNIDAVCFKCPDAFAEEGFIASATPIIPRYMPSTASISGVQPDKVSSSSAALSYSISVSEKSRSFPIRMLLPSTIAFAPRPARASNSFGAENGILFSEA